MTKANETLNMLGSNPPESETFDGEDDYMLSDIESSAGSDQDEDEVSFRSTMYRSFGNVYSCVS